MSHFRRPQTAAEIGPRRALSEGRRHVFGIGLRSARQPRYRLRVRWTSNREKGVAKDHRWERSDQIVQGEVFQSLYGIFSCCDSCVEYIIVRPPPPPRCTVMQVKKEGEAVDREKCREYFVFCVHAGQQNKVGQKSICIVSGANLPLYP